MMQDIKNIHFNEFYEICHFVNRFNLALFLIYGRMYIFRYLYY